MKITIPFATLSKKEYDPYTKAELSAFLPITSEIREVAVLSMIARPTPWIELLGYTNHRTEGSLSRKTKGKDPNEITTILKAKG